MLTKADDFPVHQTPDPIACVGTSDRNFYDRYFFNGFARDGSVFFAAALGTYPNRGIVDGAVSVVRNGRQYVLRASRVAGPERMDTHVGPIHVDVLEPLTRLRLRIDPNPWGIAGDLVFTRRAPALEEPRFFKRIGNRLLMDLTRLTQHGTWSGKLDIDGATIDVGDAGFLGMRDRSWGIRPVGERETVPTPGPIQFFWLWAPMHFDDLCTHFDVNEDADGTRWHAAGMTASADTVSTMRTVDYRLTMKPGTRHAARADIVLQPPRGEALQIDLTPLYNFYMLGLGYGHPQWGHGMYVGDNAVDGESWALADCDPAAPFYLHIQAVCEARLGSRRGIGVLEQLILGPHEPTGFRELFDMAP